jgi:hypothetical protein
MTCSLKIAQLISPGMWRVVLPQAYYDHSMLSMFKVGVHLYEGTAYTTVLQACTFVTDVTCGAVQGVPTGCKSSQMQSASRALS